MAKYVGQTVETWSSGKALVLSYKGGNQYEVQFLDTGNIGCFDTSALTAGRIKDNCKPSTFGVGYLGTGEYQSTANGKLTKEYITWQNMFKRCFCEDYKAKYPRYMSCTVSTEWHNFQNFAKWYNSQQNCHNQDYALDKDLLIQNNKLYSPSTCCLIPRKLNNALIIGTNFSVTLRENGKYLAKGKVETDRGIKSISLGTFDNLADAKIAALQGKTDYIKAVSKKYIQELPDFIVECLNEYDAVMRYNVP